MRAGQWRRRIVVLELRGGEMSDWWKDRRVIALPVADIGMGLMPAPGTTGAFWYLASPFTRRAAPRGYYDEDAAADAAHDAAEWAATLELEGISAFSPIAQAVAMVSAMGEEPMDPLNADRWMEWCLPFLHAAHGVVVPDITGWRESDGVAEEVRTALGHDKPVVRLAP